MNRAAELVIVTMLLLLALLLLWVFHELTRTGEIAGLAPLALAELPRAGARNPVTAVLLNYRAYDTLLELAVLLAALLGIWSLGPARPGYRPAGLALAGMTALIVPLLILIGGYLLWVGGHAPGGAFQAGALLGAAGVILRLAGDSGAGLPAEPAQRLLAIAGVGVFTVIGLILLALGAGFLTYPPGWAKWLILLIETAATLAIGTTLAAAYVGGRPGCPPADGADRR